LIRFISFLLGKEYEECKSCSTLKEQLNFEREEKKRLTDTLLGIIQPKAFEAPSIELSPIPHTSALFSKRRAALEEQSRQEAKILRERKHIGSSDITRHNEAVENIEKLENELNIQSEKEA
jgi:hypothetical protein